MLGAVPEIVGEQPAHLRARAQVRTRSAADPGPTWADPTGEHDLSSGAGDAPGAGGASQSWRAPWAVGLAVAAPLGVAYLIARPPSGDLAAATYRAQLFGHAGMTLWDNGWYGGHYLPGYSLLSPALGSLLGEWLLLALSVVAAAGLFGLLVERAFAPPAARVAAGVFALGICDELLSGRVAYDLGVALGLLALVALQRGHRWAAIVAALATSAASPVAGAFLALAGIAYLLAGRVPPGAAQGRRQITGIVLVASALAPVAALAVAFPEGGWEPFAPSAFWPALAGVIAIALVLARLHEELAQRTQTALWWGAWLYAVALVGSYALHTPVGSNAARLGQLLAAPLVAGALWERRRLALALVAPLLLYWQLETSLGDYTAAANDPSDNASYYTPLLAELHTLARGAPLRVEIPQTETHWEAVYVPGSGDVTLARGWERQLDTRYAALFYGKRLTATAYREWLAENAVAYVALPDTSLDFAAEAEGSLVADGLPYLHEVWRARDWRLFAVRDATPLAQPPAQMSALGVDSFTLRAPVAGRFVVRVRFTPYWALSSGAGCVSEAPGGWTTVQAARAGTITVGIDFAVARIFEHGPRCRAE